eukprot:7970269-Pyramimonas_sp.AAC.1
MPSPSPSASGCGRSVEANALLHRCSRRIRPRSRGKSGGETQSERRERDSPGDYPVLARAQNSSHIVVDSVLQLENH